MQDVEAGDKRQAAIYMTGGNHYPEINKANGGYTYKLVNRDPTDQDEMADLVINAEIGATMSKAVGVN